MSSIELDTKEWLLIIEALELLQDAHEMVYHEEKSHTSRYDFPDEAGQLAEYIENRLDA